MIRINRAVKMIFILPLIIACSFELHAFIFKAHKAGSWYPANALKLKQFIKLLDDRAQDKYAMKPDNGICAVIAPHASYTYSGDIASSVYRLVDKNNIKKVVILAPSHFDDFVGVALPHFNHYQTPLGVMNIDKESVEALKKNSLFTVRPSAYMPEHAIEMQLPFLQYYMPYVPCLPLVVGDLSHMNITQVAQALKNIVDKNTLVVVSSDFTHYGSRFNYEPFKSNAPLLIPQLDAQIFVNIMQATTDDFLQFMDITKGTVCGRLPIAVLLKLVELNTFGNVLVRLVGYKQSTEVELDSNSVSYQGIVVTRSTDNMALNQYEKNALLNYSRTILTQALNTRFSDLEILKLFITPPLRKKAGIFVTLYTHKDGKKELRGCIGTTQSQSPLYQTVADMTLASAFQDPRFDPLSNDELNDVSIEISELTPPHSVESYKDIVLNKHGIILTAGNKSALFLPRVPQELNFDFKTTLEQLSLKAGLSKDAWQDENTKFQVFESIDFEEKWPMIAEEDSGLIKLKSEYFQE